MKKLKVQVKRNERNDKINKIIDVEGMRETADRIYWDEVPGMKEIKWLIELTKVKEIY